jgi:hypothetical protein
VAKQEKPETFKTNFTPNEFIYGMIYHPYIKTEKFRPSVIVYNEKGEKIDVKIDYNDMSVDGHIPFHFLVDPYNHGKEFVFTPQRFKSAEGLDKLPYQNNKLRIVYTFEGINLAEGIMQLDMSNGAGLINEMYEKEEKLKYTFLTPPPTKFKDPAFESQVIAHYNKVKPSGTKINRVISDATAWTVYTKDVYVNNKIMTVNDYRTRTFTIIYTTEEGTCLYSFSRATQNFVNNSYGETIWEGKSLNKDSGYDFPCQNVNK